MRCGPVRSAHKQRENGHQSKIAACISFHWEPQEQGQKAEWPLMPSSKQPQVAAKLPRCCTLRGLNREKHSHGSRVHPFPDAQDGPELWRRRDHP